MNKDGPTWEEAALIYMAVLENPNAALTARASARAEILILARVADHALASFSDEVEIVALSK